MFKDFLMETRHFIKTLCQQKVKIFFKHSYRIKRQVGNTLQYSQGLSLSSLKVCLLNNF